MQGHWGGLKADPESYIGFVYLIEDLTTGQKYVGKKNYWISKPKVRGCRSKSQDKGSPKWKQCCWKESNWKVYKGSSKPLAKHMKDNPSNDYRYTILHHCRSKGVLSYTECREMYDRRVLEKLLPNGEYEYFNLAIAAIKFRPKDHMSEEAKVKLAAARKGQVLTSEVKAKISAASKGENNKSSRLLESEVLEIISILHLQDDKTLAEEYNCSSSAINKIRLGRSWKHITREPQPIPVDVKRSHQSTATTGSMNGNARLSEDQVVDIIRLLGDGLTGVQLARMFNTPTTTISNIKNSKTWKHLPRD